MATFALSYGLGALGYMFASVIEFSLPAVLAVVSLFASSGGAESRTRYLPHRPIRHRFRGPRGGSVRRPF